MIDYRPASTLVHALHLNLSLVISDALGPVAKDISQSNTIIKLALGFLDLAATAGIIAAMTLVLDNPSTLGYVLIG